MGYKHGRKNKSTKEEINHGLIIRQSAPLSYMLVQFHTHTPSEDTGLYVCVCVCVCEFVCVRVYVCMYVCIYIHI